MSCAVSPALDTETTQTHSAQQLAFDDSVFRLRLTPAASEAFYLEECRNHSVNPNNTFLKQLLAGVTVFDFENGYLGERGIVPILSTLQRLPVVELSMRNCEVTTEDVELIQKTFGSHDTFRKIDLRGITLTVAAARRLLTLAVQNPHVTEILVDEDTPKYLSIQKQCFANAELTVLASRCLVCNRPVIHSPDQKIEGRLLLSLGEELDTMLPAQTGVALQAMFRCILACCEVDDGVLFLCSGECRLHLTKDILTAMHAVVGKRFSGEQTAYPANPILRRCVEGILKTPLGKPVKTVNNNDIHVGDNLRTRVTCSDKYDVDEDDEEDEDDSNGRNILDEVEEECSICGVHAVCLPNGGLQAMRRVCKEIAEGSVLRPSALFRLAKLMMQYTDIRPCSKKCVTHLVRFGIYGYGGVLRPSSKKNDQYVSLLDIPLTNLPIENFAVLNFSAAYIEELDEEDTTCALTVASAMSDMDGVAIDPYMVFAFGRHLARLPSHVLGMELRHACEAVQVVGCLPASLGPFDRRKERPPRSRYVSWEKWSEYADVDNIVRVAFSRRRQGVYLIDGPHGNMFDNTRAALWAFRKQRRAVLVAMKFSLEWLAFPGGVVKNESPLKRGFLTTFKVVGQTNIDNAFYLICQGNFGPRVGNNGFFYIPRGIFNLYVTGDAYIFIDAGAYMTLRGHRRNLYAARILPKKVMELAEQIPLLKEVHYLCIEALNWKTRHRLEVTKIVFEALCHLPPPIFFIYRGCDRDVAETQEELLRTLRKIVFMGNSRSLLLFYLHEVLGLRSVEWVHALVQQISQYPPLPVLLQKHAECLRAADLERRWTRIQWTSLEAEKSLPIRIAAPAPEPSRRGRPSSKRLAKVTGGKKSGKEARDAFMNRLENRWKTLRERRELMRGVPSLSRSTRQSTGQYPFGPGTASVSTARSMALENDSVPLSLVGHPWHSVRLTEADGKLTDYVLFFIKDHTCCFNTKNHTITEPLHPILENPFTCRFPFATGFDCVLHSPVNPRTAYFFCGEQWIEWDTYWQTCTGGPFKLQLHQQFAALPQEFFRKIDAAVPVPNTSYAFLFSQLMYILMDLEQRRPVDTVKRIGDMTKSEKNLPTFNTTLARLFPYGPMTTLLWSVEKEIECDKKNEWEGKRKPPETGGELADVEKMSVMLIGREGRVVIVHSFAPSVSTMKSDEYQTVPSTSLSRLPQALQQMTTAALHGVCKHVLDAECNRCGVVLNNLDHGGQLAETITSTLTQKREELMDLLSLTRQDGTCNVTSLLCEEVVFVQTEESLLGYLPQVIEVDYGFTYPVAFGALVVVLDTTRLDYRVLRVAPIRAVVESSDDGIVYVKHTCFVLTPYVTATCWGDAHAARFWRLRFITRLPVGTGVVRLLWYEVLRALEAIPLDPSVPLQPHHSIRVNITAPHILCKPAELLNYLAPGAVFASSSSDGWLEKHCILPLLPDGVFCLFFCGKNFVELDLRSNIVVSHRTIPLASHPGFAHLPYPFLCGFDAVFYPNLQTPSVVAIVHGKEIILWNLKLGSEELQSNPNDPNLFFKGLPWSMDQIEDIVQIWDCPGEFFLIRSQQVLRWNIFTAEVVEGPMLLRNCPYLYHKEFDGKTILCVTSFPKDPRCFYVFCEDRVAFQTVTDGIVSDRVGPICVSQMDLFSSMTWYLNWGKRRRSSVIHIDFMEEQPLLVGIVIRSSEPCDEDWLIEYSDDGLDWKTVGHHLQSSGLSRTMWGLASVEFTSHRLWRLTTDATQSYCVRNQPVFYMSVVFYTLPCTPYLQSAHKIALSGTLNGPISELFMKGKTTVAFESLTEFANEHNPKTHHVTLEYGVLKSPNLMAFTCRCVEGWVNAVWGVWCSDDGSRWEQCGLWRSRFGHFKASWKPRGPRRYWRIELQTWEPNVLFENFYLFEYSGPSIAVENSTPVGDGWDPSILWEKNSAGCKVTPMTFLAHVGTALVFENKKDSAHVVGVRLVSHEKQSTSTTFVVECSLDAVEWRTLNVFLLLRNGSAQAAWESGDYYQFWRLRIVQHTGPSFLTLRDICFETFKPTLYRVVEPKKVNAESPGFEVFHFGAEPKEMVAVQVVLPPDSVYIVEKLSPDGAAWEEVAIIQNSDTTQSRTVHQGWVPRGSSSCWRLRPAVQNFEEGYVVSPPSLSTDMSAQWYSFSGKMLVSSKLSDIPSVGVTTTGFLEVQAPGRLTENKTDTVVLRSIGQQKVMTVTWCFEKGTTPLFHQVFLKGRRFTDLIRSMSLSSLSQHKKSTPTMNSSTKASTRAGTTVLAGASEGEGNGNTEGEAEEEMQKEEDGSCITIVVETSEDGVNFVPIAERPFSQLGNSLSWPTNVASSYWRIRFKGIREDENLELRQVTWFQETGATTALAPPIPCMASHSMYSKWQDAAFNYEEEFCQNCREGFDQARSVLSGLREPNDIERHGRLAKGVIRLRARFMNFVAKTSKEATKEKNPPHDKFVSIGQTLSNDIMYLLYKATINYGCNVDELNQLVEHPMLLSRDFVRSADNNSWFYPKFDETGTLVESFYGFHNVRASLTVLWSLSVQLQKNTDLLFHPSMTPLSPHLASVIITINIERDNWIAAEHFPELPLLYYAGFTERPMVIVFALNQVKFTSKYNLTIPGAACFPATFPFRILPGVNFLQRMPLTACPFPLFDCLQMIYSKEFLGNYETEVVFTSPSMHSSTGLVCFTLPGEGINFSIPGLKIESIEFEVQLNVERDIGEEGDTAVMEQTGAEDDFSKVTFFTHNSVFKGAAEDPPVQITLLGVFHQTEDRIAVRGVSPSAHVPVLCRFPDAFITDLNISFDLVAGEAPQSFVEPFFTVAGTLTTPTCGSYDCQFFQVRLNRGHESIALQVVSLQLAKFIHLGNYMVNSLSQVQNMDWLRNVPVACSFNLKMCYSELRVFGSGNICILDFRGDAFAIISPDGVGITATLPTLRFGDILLKGKSDKECVVVNIAAPASAPSVIRIDGYSSLLATQPYPTKIEITQEGVMCISTGVFYDVCIEEESFFPSGAYAQVTISRGAIADCLSELLQETPMIVAFLATGIPFSLEVEEVVGEECLLERKLLFLTVRGVLFGCRFDVMTSVLSPDNTIEEARRICQDLIPRIVEQCDESLWASYELLAGCFLPLDSPERERVAEEGGKGAVDEESGKKDEEAALSPTGQPAPERNSLKAESGQFIGYWIACECEALDKEIQEDFETVACENPKWSFV
ncbi:hypothetical protein TcCL_ESM05284 [Trypanosoma cruzi]|nr:hypothetical protein TcCL_ESM05284 [Trypanosoma cruzi]